MNRFTIAPEFLECCAQEETCDLFLNVLMVFTQDNEYKLCMDDAGRAMSAYQGIIERFEYLRSWIKWLNRSPRNIELVSIPAVNDHSEQSLFLAISDAVFPSKKLVTSEKSRYAAWQVFIAEHSINLIDGDEAKGQLQRTTVINQNTSGDNSPNIIGNFNTIQP